jgi:2-succinyl-6-hydroxy-2,4-cyclohexadiene-1-carboxylate synthase
VIWCLHGFVGRGADWEPFRAACAAAGLPQVEAPDLFAHDAFGPRAGSLAAWGAWFAAYVAERDPDPALVGYSLGGRLALHALLARPAGWRAAVIVSAHPGLDTKAKRGRRARDDEQWAERFARDPWDALMVDWNARAVFGGGAPLDRPEAAYDRAALTGALQHWSLGAQAPLLPRLPSIGARVLWIAGARDPRYVALGELAAGALPRGELRVAPEAGHRVPWEDEGWFCQTVCDWLDQ